VSVVPVRAAVSRQEEHKVNKVEIGVQTYTYRKFDVPGIIRELKGTGITALEAWTRHLNCDMPAAEVKKARKMLSDAGIRIAGVGVYGFSSEKPDEMKRMLEFAASLKCDYVSLDVKADDTKGKEMLVELARKLKLLLGIHNHGPGHHYDTAEKVLASVQACGMELGACVDTGHFLRVGQTADHVIKVLGKRVHAVHLKDFIDASTEVVPGTGKLDYAAALKALKDYTNFHTAFVIEYEADPDNPTPGMRQTVSVFKQAIEKMG
jgi:inosose dehydratase